MRFFIKDHCEIKGKKVKFTVGITDFGKLTNDDGIDYETCNVFGEAQFNGSYLTIDKNSFKYRPNFLPPNLLNLEDVRYIEELLNDSIVWDKVIKEFNKRR